VIPELSWQQALRWASFAEEFQLSRCISIYKIAFDLLPEILWIGHPISVRHDALRRLDIPSATSGAVRACIRLSDLPTAIEFLEQGLAIIFQQMLQLKTDVDLLPPEQAQEFRNLSSKLYGEQSAQPIQIVEARNRLITSIRNQSGFEYFLLPKSYDALCRASQGGPVVILTSDQDCCNAIIILNPISEPIHVPLPNITVAELNRQRDTLRELLGRCDVRYRGEPRFYRRECFWYKPNHECFEYLLNWLWNNIVEHVYGALKLVSENSFVTGRTNICLLISMGFPVEDSGGCQQVDLLDCLCMQARPQMTSFTHTQRLWDLFWMPMRKELPQVHLNYLLLV
jgi:hypothetical protein